MPGPNIEVPFHPIRHTLYTSRELMDVYNPADPGSMGRTLDFLSYRYYVANGAAAASDPYAGMMEALHDNSILRAMTSFLKDANRPTVAIMGGHGERRDTANYRAVVEIARQLTRANCLVASGGGPGAMEATHLGALLAHEASSEVDAALELLKTQPKLPDSAKVVGPDGIVDELILAQLHAWAKPAYEIAEKYPSGGESLAVPTWYYGHEPLSPLATHVAKYFQNSIREDVLLSLAANGIIYTAGAAGTLQEVFQDAAQNYYPKPGESFAPMVFYGAKFWNDTLPVRPVLQALFVGNKHLTQADFDRLVVIVDTVEDAVASLLDHGPTEAKTANRMVALGFGPMLETV